jgi:hypothetical protein
MRRGIFLGSVLGLALAIAPAAEAAIGAPASIGTRYQASGSATNVITTTVDAPPASLIVVPTGYAGTTTITSVADSAGNCGGAYAVNTGASVQAGSKRVAIYFCNVTGSDLPVGGTITTTFANSAANEAAMAFTVSGIATSSPGDVSGSGSGSGQGVTGISATPSSANAEILIACVWISNGATGDNYVEDPAWTAITPVAGSSTNLLLHCAYKVVSSTTPVAWAPTWTNIRAWTTVYTSYKGAPVASAPPGGALSLLGLVGR